MVFAGYTIVSALGAGGMGEVYLAEHPRLPRREALKILSPAVSADPSFRERFIREAHLAGALNHPNIVRVNDRGDVDGQLWLSMDYIDGIDAAQLLHDRYPAGMPADEAIAVVAAVADALDYAHAQGLLHRDVKPANILLSQPGGSDARRVFLADFGIAREVADSSGLTATNLTVGTVAYASPEQLMGADLDGRSDQYALAATAFQLLSGSAPYTNSNPVAVIGNQLNAPIPSLRSHRPELSALDHVLARALAKDPQDRYPSCADFAKDLVTHARSGIGPGDATQLAVPRSAPPAGPVPESRKRHLKIGAVAIAAVLAASGTGYLVIYNTQKEKGSASPPAVLDGTYRFD